MNECQSCGVPFNKEHEHLVAMESNGEKSIYCKFCYVDGKFTDPNLTLLQAIELGVPHLSNKVGEAKAREILTELIPTLIRWE